MKYVVRFRATERDRRRLAWLARHFDRSPSEVLRRIIADEHARVLAVLKVVRKRKVSS
jgi:hypothetical protein